MGLRKLILALLTAIFLGGPVVAQPVDPEKITQTIHLYDAVVAYPAPSWQRTADPTHASEFYRNQNGPTFILEQIPKGEKFEKWNRMYAVFAVKIQGLAFKDFINQTLAPFFSVCGKENFSVVPLQQQADAITLRILCQNSPSGPAKFGYGDGVGEVTLIRFGQVGSTFIKVYHHWRGKSFMATDPASWPVPAAELETMVKRFETIRFIGKPG